MSDEEIWKRGIDLSYVIDAYRNLNMDDHFLPFLLRTVDRHRLRAQNDKGREERRRNQGKMERRRREIQGTAQALSALRRIKTCTIHYLQCTISEKVQFKSKWEGTTVYTKETPHGKL